MTISCGFVIEDRFEPDQVDLSARQASLTELPDDVLQYLLPSRYCETDRLTDIAWKLFGHLPLSRTYPSLLIAD